MLLRFNKAAGKKTNCPVYTTASQSDLGLVQLESLSLANNHSDKSPSHHPLIILIWSNRPVQRASCLQRQIEAGSAEKPALGMYEVAITKFAAAPLILCLLCNNSIHQHSSSRVYPGQRERGQGAEIEL